ncbi:MAG: 16S rRNA (uracil(1498)-N(3))-methyltransferase [Thermodesulfovibrionales bacterium]
MNLILLHKDDFIGGTNRVRLQGRRLQHVLTVLRAKPGDELAIGLTDGLLGRGRVTEISEEELEMETTLGKEPPAALPVTLLLALPRPKVLRRVLLTASSMGVKKIFLINAFRVEKSFWKSPLLAEGPLRQQLVLGLEQAGDTVMPEVLLRPLFKPFVEDELPGLITGTTPLAAHPAAEKGWPEQTAGPVTLAIGPEGGFIPYETDKLRDCGFRTVSLGKRILRVEAALPALLSKLF